MSVFATLPKKPKATGCPAFCNISLMSHVSKLLLAILLKRMQSKVDIEVRSSLASIRTAEQGKPFSQ